MLISRFNCICNQPCCRLYHVICIKDLGVEQSQCPLVPLRALGPLLSPPTIAALSETSTRTFKAVEAPEAIRVEG